MAAEGEGALIAQLYAVWEKHHEGRGNGDVAGCSGSRRRRRRRGSVAWLKRAVRTNLIWPNGSVEGLDLAGGRVLVVRDYEGRQAPLPIRVSDAMDMGTDGVLRIVLDEDGWDSTISFEEGIPVALGGTLELTFAPGVDPRGQIGRTFRLFDWSGVSPVGAFSVARPHEWDLASLYTTGEVTLVPEPVTLALLALGALGVLRGRRR
jgi:hypothetical protein